MSVFLSHVAAMLYTTLPAFVSLAVGASAVTDSSRAEGVEASNDRSPIISVGERDVQAVVDAAPPHSIVVCDRNHQVVLSQPVRIRKPLTIRGLNARLPAKLGRTSLVIVQSEGVVVSDFELHGNGDTVPQDRRAALLAIEAGDFCVERGAFYNSSKDGILIDGGALVGNDLTGGVVRDVVGRVIRRDLVSVGGSGSEGHRVRSVLIDNVRCYGSQYRGAVEVSDGSDRITVRTVYAEGCVYAVDVQDHKHPGQVNTNVFIQDVHARDCTHAIRTANHPLGHANLTIRDVIAERCAAPLQIRNTDNVVLHNVTILDHASPRPPISLSNCDGLSLRDLTIKGGNYRGPGVMVEDCDGALVDGITLQGRAGSPSSALCYRITTDEAFSGLRISNVFAPRAGPAGILLDRQGGRGALTDYVILGNVARVVDRIQGPRGVIANNTHPDLNDQPPIVPAPAASEKPIR